MMHDDPKTIPNKLPLHFNANKTTRKTQNDSNKQNKKIKTLLKEKEQSTTKKIIEPAKRFKSHLIKGC